MIGHYVFLRWGDRELFANTINKKAFLLFMIGTGTFAFVFEQWVSCTMSWFFDVTFTSAFIDHHSTCSCVI